MKRRCTPHLVKEAHRKARSWRKAASALNDLYQVNLHFLAWRDFATGRRDITDPLARAALLLGDRPCPACGNRQGLQVTRLLARLTVRDLKQWGDLRRDRKYKAASHYLEEVYRRKMKRGSRKS